MSSTTIYHYTYLIIDGNPPTEKKFYIGSRSSSTPPELDSYMSSSTCGLFQSRVKSNPEEFKKIILGTYKTRAEANLSEIAYHRVNRVSDNPEFYNKSEATSTGAYAIGYVTVMDRETGKCFNIESSNPDYINGKYISVASGTVTVKNRATNEYSKITVDEYNSNPSLYETLIESKSKGKVVCKKNGVSYSVDINEFKNGNHVGVNSGMKVCNVNGKPTRVPTSSSEKSIAYGTVKVRDINGIVHSVSVDDPRYLSGELVHNTKGFTVVKDSQGNTMQVSADDPRLLSGELVGIASKMCVAYDVDENRIRVSTLDPRWATNELVGHKSKYAIITDGIAKKIIKQTILNQFKGWSVLKLRS